MNTTHTPNATPQIPAPRTEPTPAICGHTTTAAGHQWTCVITGPHQATRDGRTMHHFRKTHELTPEGHTEPAAASATPACHLSYLTDDSADRNTPYTLTEAITAATPTTLIARPHCAYCSEAPIAYEGITLNQATGTLDTFHVCNNGACTGAMRTEPNTITRPTTAPAAGGTR